MNNSIISALNATLSKLVFTDRMQQNVFRQIENQRIEQARARAENHRRYKRLAALTAVAAAFVLLTAVQFGMNHQQVGDPVNTPPHLADSNAVFVPIGDGSAALATSDAAEQTPSPTSFAEVNEDLTAEPQWTTLPTTSPYAVPGPTVTVVFRATEGVTPSPTPIPTPTATPVPTPTATPVPTPTATPVPTPTATPVPTPTATPVPTPTATPVPTPTATPVPTPTATPMPTPTATPVPTPTATPVPTPTVTPVPTPTATPVPTPTATPEPTPEPPPSPTPVPVKLVEASYTIRDTTKFTCEQALMSVYSNDTSEMTVQFTYVSAWNYSLPDGAFLRLTKVDGVEGNYGQATVTTISKGQNKHSQFSATISFDRAFGKAEYITFSLCKADGTELFPLKFKLDKFDSEDGKWPTPESTPLVPTIPPISPTPTPTPRPTLAPGATEPPQDTALYTVTFVPGEFPDEYTPDRCILRVYEEMSVMTIDFAYKEALPENAYLRLAIVDGNSANFGEGPIVSNGDGSCTATFYFNQQVGYMKDMTLRARVPEQSGILFMVKYRLRSGSIFPDGWDELEPLATAVPVTTPVPTPLPAGVTATPAPTIPADLRYSSYSRLALLDPVERFSLISASHYRYDIGLSLLEVNFRYTGELPANPILRIVQCETTEGNFGEAPIVRNDNGTLTASIVTNHLQGSAQALRLKCYDGNNNEQFYADFYVDISSGAWSGGYEANNARHMLPTATPEPSETPVPTPTVAATADPSVSPTPAPTEPPYSEARSKRVFQLVDKVSGYANYNVTLRRYTDFDVLTVYFRYNKDLPEGTVLQLVQVDTLLDSFGEALIVPSELENARTDLLCAKIASDRIPLNCASLRLRAVSPEGDVIFQADYYPDERGYSADNARKLLNSLPEATPTPPSATLEPGTTATPSPTEPPYDTATSKDQYQLLDKVALYTHYNVTLRRYADDVSVMTVYFRYNEDIPEGTILRLTQVDDVRMNFGEGVIGPATLESGPDNLLGAKIYCTSLPETLRGFRVNAITPDGTELFQATFYPEGSRYADLIRDLLNPTATSAPTTASSSGGKTIDYSINTNPPNSYFPTPTPYKSPLQESIEDGMQIKPPTPGGFSW